VSVNTSVVTLPGNAQNRMAQTALPRPVTGLQPQTSQSASTICRPRPHSSLRSGTRSTGAVSDGSSTAHMTSPLRRSSRKPTGCPEPTQRAACDTALATNSPTMASASSASEARPQSFRVFLVNLRAVRPDWAPVPSGQAATAGESHQSEGIRTTLGRPGPRCSRAVKSTGRRTAGSILVRVGNPTWLKPIATPRSVCTAVPADRRKSHPARDHTFHARPNARSFVTCTERVHLSQPFHGWPGLTSRPMVQGPPEPPGRQLSVAPAALPPPYPGPGPGLGPRWLG
jgi:hypothetical protein